MGRAVAGSRSTADGGSNDALIQCLAELGWSRRGFAFRLGERCQVLGLSNPVNPSTVSRWCANRTVPRDELAAAACSVLSDGLRRRVSPQSLGWPTSDSDLASESLEYKDLSHAVRMLSRLWELDSVRRHSIVSTFSAGVFGAASREALVMPADERIARPGTFRVTAADVELLDDHTELYGRKDAAHGGGTFRSVFAALLATHATPLLLDGQFSERTGRRLYGSVVDAVLAMASMAYDDQLAGLAQRYDLQAMRLAQAIGDRARIARVHIHQARLAATQGDRRDVLTHARSAVLASEGGAPLMKAYAAITEARAWAYNANPEQALAAVARARGCFDRSRPSDPHWLGWFDRHELEAQAAWALAAAGLSEAGTQALKEAQGMPGERTRDSVELLITGAELARLRGDLTSHSELTKQAAAAARGLESRRLTSRIARLTAGLPLDEF